MTAPTLRQLLADVLWDQCSTAGSHLVCSVNHDAQADALLASPELAAIIDLAAEYDHDGTWIAPTDAAQSPDVRALLADWRASRAEQKPPP